MIEVEVIIEKFGNYSKGDKLKMYASTAKACSKAVKIVTKKRSKK